MNQKHLTTFAALIIALFAILGIGTVQVRQNFLTRGIPANLPEPIQHGGVQMGVNVDLSQYDDAELTAVLTQIEELGIQTVKQSFYWRPDFDWAASARLVTAVSQHNLTLVPLLDGDPASDFAPPANPNQFASWAAEFAARYQGSIHTYIIWDEPNLTSHWGGRFVNANEYAALLTASAKAIRNADRDAIIVAAPLAPTVETGPLNLAAHLYLQQLYEAGAADAFDIAAGKPYGFKSEPDDRRVETHTLNFSHIILMRETLIQNGDGHKAIWAGNWGWNSLPDDWAGKPSLWGETTAQQQADWSVAALERARLEWPWMGVMFLETWEPDLPTDDPHWGFSLANNPRLLESLGEYFTRQTAQVAYPGFHQAEPNQPAQQYEGGWRFAPEFGADISQTAEGQPPDRVTFTFYGTDVGLRVRRADFRARLYISVDGQPANTLPSDENGTMLLLTSPDPAEDFVVTIPVAHNLPPGQHTLTAVASRGWDQWALKGFSVGYAPPSSAKYGMLGLLATAVAALFIAYRVGRQADWRVLGDAFRGRFLRLSAGVQWGLTAVTAAVVALTGWLTWGQQAAGLYRRLEDADQLMVTAVAAAIFYIAPSFFIYAAALLILFLLLTLRPAWGLLLIAFSFPFYVQPVLKPVFSYRFSPIEIFTLLTFAAWIFSVINSQLSVIRYPLSVASEQLSVNRGQSSAFSTKVDVAVLLFTAVATASLFFTERLGVATNEWRLVIIEPALFYLLLRQIRPTKKEMGWLLDAFVAGGVLVALIGLWQYGTGQAQDLITAEGGLLRLRSIYGSPNNVALYLGRIVPLLAATSLLGQQTPKWRRWAYGAALPVLLLAVLLSFSKGGILLGIPAGLLVVFWVWQRRNGRSPWPWLLLFFSLGVLALFMAQRIPQLAGRFDIQGATSVFRLNLWGASLSMIKEHPWWGVGLDNFLYAYRGRYIFDAAWQEPHLNHPHNILLDFGTRLGLLGLASGGWMIWQLFQTLRHAATRLSAEWLPVAVGLGGGLAAMLVHGLVDHSFFLIDLAFAFYLMLGTAVWLVEIGD